LSETASALLQLKRGTFLQTTADEAFARLADAVTALRTRGAAHPLTVPVAVASAKRELSGRIVAVGVHDALASALSDLHQHPDFLYTDSNQEQEAGGYGAMLARIEESVRLPAALTATLAYWGGEDTGSWWAPELERFSYRSRGSGLVRLLSVRRVAGLWLFYAAGVSAVAAGRWKEINAMLRTTVTHPHGSNERMSLADFYQPEQIYYENAPAGRELYAKLSPLLIETLAISLAAVEDAWQTFEVLRIAAGISSKERFESALADLETAANQVDLRERAWEEANRTGGDVGGAQTMRHEAHQAWSKRLEVLVNMGSFGRVHVLTADRMHPDDNHLSVQAQKTHRRGRSSPGLASVRRGGHVHRAAGAVGRPRSGLTRSRQDRRGARMVPSLARRRGGTDDDVARHRKDHRRARHAVRSRLGTPASLWAESNRSRARP
jgi:hypothetical protein